MAAIARDEGQPMTLQLYFARGFTVTYSGDVDFFCGADFYDDMGRAVRRFSGQAITLGTGGGAFCAQLLQEHLTDFCRIL